MEKEAVTAMLWALGVFSLLLVFWWLKGDD